MKCTLLLTLLIVINSIVYSQIGKMEFGRISQSEMDYSHHPHDKTAEAVVLFDIGKSYFNRPNNKLELIFERTTRIKIISEAGVKWAEVDVPYYQEGGIYEKVYSIEANTYNYENGELIITKLNKENIYNEQTTEAWNSTKFALPDVKPGSIIEYKYKVSSQYMFNLEDWEFQWKIPVLYSEYEVRMTPFYEYTFLLQGASKFDSQTSYIDKGLRRQFASVSYQEMVHKYVMKDLPAFYDEEYITSINDYIIKIDFQLAKINYPNGSTVDVASTWPKMIDELSKHTDFGKYIKKSEKLAMNSLGFDSLFALTSEEKFDAVLTYVKGNYNWNEYNRKFASKSPNEFLKDKLGNSADVNLFVVGLLKAVGIEAYPVLTSTRNHGKVKVDYPFSHFFNYVIVLAKIDGKVILSDATEVLSSNDRIPTRCINDKGLIVNKDKVDWVGLQGLSLSTERMKFNIKLSEFDYNAEIVNVSTEYNALYYRKHFGTNNKKIRDELIENGYNIIDSTIKIENFMNIEDPYKFQYTVEGRNEYINNTIYVSPFLNEIITDIPFKQNVRTYPIDMVYPKIKSFSSQISIPEGYVVDYVPENTVVKNALFELNYKVDSTTEVIFVSFSYFFKKPIYAAAEYSRIKYYFKEIVRLGNDKIVFKKLE